MVDLKTPRKVCFLLLISLGATSAYAQNYISFVAGLGYSDFDLPADAYDKVNVSTGSGFFGGLQFVNLPKNGKTPGVKLSAVYSARNATVENNGVLHASQFSTLDLDFLSHIYVKPGRSYIYLDVGPALSVLMSKDANDLLLDENSEQLAMNSSLLSATAGLGFDHQLKGSIVGVYMHYKIALSNLYSETQSPSNQLHIGLSYMILL